MVPTPNGKHTRSGECLTNQLKMDQIRQAFVAAARTRIVILYQVPLTWVDCITLVELLITDGRMDSLKLIECQIDEDAIQFLLERIMDNKTGLRALHLIELQLTDVSCTYLADLIDRDDSTIRLLDLRMNQIGPEGARVLAQALPGSKLQWLVLDWNRIGNRGLEHLCDAIGTGKTNLSRLGISRNQITNTVYPRFAEALIRSKIAGISLNKHRHLTSHEIRLFCGAFETAVIHHDANGGAGKDKILMMSNNGLRDDSTVEIARLISGKVKLVQLELDDNHFTDVGLIQLGRAIKESNTFNNLFVQRTSGLTDLGVEAFIELIKGHPSFRSFGVVGCPGVSPRVQQWAGEYVKNLQSRKSKLLVALASVHYIPRISTGAAVKRIPIDLIRRMNETI